MDAVAETESLIREKLESSGQMAKLRAMVVDASLKAITNDGKDASSLFDSSKALIATKVDPLGLQALSAVVGYLEYLGLNYTASVFALEAGLKGVSLTKDTDLRKAFNLPTEQPTIISLLSQARKGTTAVVAPIAVPLVAPAVPSVPAVVVPTSTPKPAAAAPKSKSVDTLYEIAEWEGKDFTRFKQVAGQQVQLYKLKDCKVHVLDPLDSMTADVCDGGQLVLAACEGSLFLRDCKNMVVYAACKQLRLRDCQNMTIHLFAATDPVVEASHHIDIKPFNLRLPNMIASFKAARLDAAVNRFVHVYDFTADDAKIPQPHYTVIYPNHGLKMEDIAGDLGTPECPKEIEDLLEGRLAPAASSESGQNKSHNIKSGANAWTGAKTAVPVPSTAAAVPKPADVKPIEVKPVEVKPVPVVVKPVEVKPVDVKESIEAPPTVPVPRPKAAETKPSGADDHYSSFSESSSDDDKYEVDEDDDEF